MTEDDDRDPDFQGGEVENFFHIGVPEGYTPPGPVPLYTPESGVFAVDLDFTSDASIVRDPSLCLHEIIPDPVQRVGIVDVDSFVKNGFCLQFGYLVEAFRSGLVILMDFSFERVASQGNGISLDGLPIVLDF